ncbi:MAG: tRNA (adenosine(37)-N6)-threonylcarbamoyltransferase complex dimerization subunit type 1 TsaB, partial [Synergistaceae bacterium]|nr:tRNA (adenosine(37)-N6)-threonylcarbamoyltransferase complex dimerization subunit type 1 TsaB [Synergistaceae bacterium]
MSNKSLIPNPSFLIAFDCCLRLTGVALKVGEEIIYSQEDLGRRQSSELPRMTEKLLREKNLAWEDIGCIALTNGPGYFTGIRVGAAYAIGLAYALGAKIIPVSSLEMLSHAFGKNNNHEKILTLIYAGHGFVYAEAKNFLEPGQYSHDFVRSWLEKNPDAVVISDDSDRLGSPPKIPPQKGETRA